MDGHGWSDGGEKDALAFSAMHPVFPGQHLSAPFQDLTDSTKPPLSYSFGFGEGEEKLKHEEKGKRILSQCCLSIKPPMSAEKGDNSAGVPRPTPPPHCRV